MSHEPIDDIVAWSATQPRWQQDCLRRLATGSDLTQTDLDELLAMVKAEAGFDMPSSQPEILPLSKEDIGSPSLAPITLKAVANIKGVNRLSEDTTLTFCPNALTIIYGRNGSGKSGFVRILRTACRTRIEDEAELKVLSDVYGKGTLAQSAEIIVNDGVGDTSIEWKPGMAVARSLKQVAVFDSSAAQIYVDGGNQIRFLPFGLALPHRLNGVCLQLKSALDYERKAAVGDKDRLTSIRFPIVRHTAAQVFNEKVSKHTSDAEIEAATCFSPEDDVRLEEVLGLVNANAAASADLTSLATWAVALVSECAKAVDAYSDNGLDRLLTLKQREASAQDAAKIASEALFADQPLKGVGSESWHALWVAARNFSTLEAYRDKEFPVLSDSEVSAACVLCQQPLLSDGVSRMKRFQDYMGKTLETAASQAETDVSEANAALPKLIYLSAEDFPDRIEQVRARDPKLADELTEFRLRIVARARRAQELLAGDEKTAILELISPLEAVSSFAEKLSLEKDALKMASDASERQRLIDEKAELEDRKLLNLNIAMLTTRRDLLAIDATYVGALALVATSGITKRANELLDTHLTSAVVERFEHERACFGIDHLKIGLSRKSDRTKAEYTTDTQTTLTKTTSHILSEGEQRALALAGFLTEVALTEGAGPIVVDDPVSSLDRERGALVAERLAVEATSRQVIVFTHDIVFFNELCKAAESKEIEPVTIALFGDRNASGKIDAAGMVWKGLNVAKRIGQIKNKFAPLPKLNESSPSDYEYEIKGLYGRLRDAYERMVEETIFCDIVRRSSDVVQTQRLRYVTLPDELAIRFHEGMSRANTHSHDNPAADTVLVPSPTTFAKHVNELEELIVDFEKAKKLAEVNRPQMKPNK